MRFHSTRNSEITASLEEAIFRSLPADNGLYMPDEIPLLPPGFFSRIEQLTFNELAVEVTHTLLGSDLTRDEIVQVINTAFNFTAPIVEVKPDEYILELFHGPSMAFKDFGARFMAALMSHFLVKQDRRINILVATSGDTGGAVAQGFYKVPGIEVTILYPSGKVSDIQEKQLTTLGANVRALEIDGTFDDCQNLVKQAFLDKELNEKLQLSSANSINIARLIPQSFYYFSAYAQLVHKGRPVVFSVPSGNFGNLSAGLLAWRMGLPVQQFIASTNINNAVPLFLESGEYHPKPSVPTLSNAMDVGNPSNFVRMTRFLHDDPATIGKMVKGYYFDDNQTREKMTAFYKETNYVMCPHTAVAYLGLEQFRKNNSEEISGVVLSTAHPAKFLELVEKTIEEKVEIPNNLEILLEKEKQSLKMDNSFGNFKSWLLDSYV